MPIKDKESGKKLQSAIEAVVKSDYSWIKNSSNFKFDWSIESDNEVYKIYLLDSEDQILGLISLTDYPEEFRIHMNLIETSANQRGDIKTIENIAGCLLAFGCEVAFNRGYDGFMSLLPKTKLIDLYQDKYGFRQFGRLLAVEGRIARSLIEKYLLDEES
ncbi:MAG: GNAT family N-acetyltransferase [Bacteroidota bacterium]